MFYRILMVMAIALVFISTTHAGTGPNLRDGEWEITVSFDVPGMPMQMPPNTYTQCLSQKDPVPKSEKPNQVCEIKDMKTKGNTVTWNVECTNRGGKMAGNGIVTYKGDKMEGKMTMTMEGQTASMISHYKGVRLGECK